MPDYDDFDLDRSVSRAWTGFQSRLADALVAMDEGDHLVISAMTGEPPTDGAEPYVQFAAFDEGVLRGEVASNQFLAPRYALDDARLATLAEQGWQGPDLNHWVDLPADQADRLAVMTVRVLRDVFDVPHPAFLTADTREKSDGLGLTAARPEPAIEVADDEPLATTPTDPAHLRALVDAALTPVFGHPPYKDDDGDIPVPHHTTLVFVRVLDEDPVVELFSIVVSGVRDLPAARLEVGVLNRRYRFIKFVVIDDKVMAHIQLPSFPFVPHTLRAMLALMTSSLDEIDEDLALRTGGRRAFEPADEEDGQTALGETIHPTLRRIVELAPTTPHGMPGEVVSVFCDGSAERMMAFLGTASRLERYWRHAREAAIVDGDEAYAEECRDELRGWEATTSALRRGLRWMARRSPDG